LGENKQTGHGFIYYLFHASKGIADKKVIPQSGRGVIYVKRKKKQKGKGFITDLLKTGAKQVLRVAAQTGLNVLDNTRSLKEAIKTHGILAIKFIAQPLLARGGPKKLNKRPTSFQNRKKAPIKKLSRPRPQSIRPRPQTKRPPRRHSSRSQRLRDLLKT
jgi:hypothetical protein